MNEKNLREIRHELDLSIEHLAQILEVSSLTVSKWERGINKPNFKSKIKIKKFLKDRNIDNIFLN